MKRRSFSSLFGIAGLGYLGHHFWPDQGFLNPCFRQPVPPALLEHDVVKSALQDIDLTMSWDGHVHLVGIGDSEQGPWIDPLMNQWYHPLKYLQRQFYLNASCVSDSKQVDKDYVNRLEQLHKDMPKGSKIMLLAFDHHYAVSGVKDLQRSPFYIPNQYAARIARAYPERFEWIASIHPYRRDAVNALRLAVEKGARAVK